MVLKKLNKHDKEKCLYTPIKLPKEDGAYLCTVCSETFPERLVLLKHLLGHDQRKLKDYGYNSIMVSW